MPGGDRTGPSGNGAMTGRGLGYGGTGENIRIGRRGIGRHACGFGFTNRNFSNVKTNNFIQENNTLTSHIKNLEERLEALENRDK